MRREEQRVVLRGPAEQGAPDRPRRRRVGPCDADSSELRHPVVGRVTVTQQTLSVARSPEQVLIVCTTPEGSASEEALTLLRQVSGRKPDAAQPARVPGRPVRVPGRPVRVPGRPVRVPG
ncbi:hypothetical protein [Amycolatopsis rubida]|uniref:MmyB family transcriptional regulator n=1 Tax=Amycolatopsis rubida TaxID=112413 RepID=UPI003CC7AB92